MQFLFDSIGSIVTVLVLILISALAVIVVYKRRKGGKSSCGGDCDFCSLDCKQKMTLSNRK